MPSDFSAWARVCAFFRRWREHGPITKFHDRLRGRVREREGREAELRAGVIDAQSVRAAATVPAASRGYDGGKKVPGRKRHIVKSLSADTSVTMGLSDNSARRGSDRPPPCAWCQSRGERVALPPSRPTLMPASTTST
ncbi:transposase [Streptomyces sp. MUM 203J]|uniref:transposase n=1 Tax=Streptomyces sp. MUM 203J TaxID=2791990 RepID=UPI0035ABACE4